MLAVHELVTNARRHGGTAATVTVIPAVDGIHVTVRHPGTAVAVPPPPDPLAEHGRGLRLAAALVDELTSSVDAGVVTWRLVVRVPPG